MATIRRHKALLLKNVHKNASIAWRTGTRIRRFRRPGRTETTFALRCARRRTANRHGSRIGASADTGDGVAPEWQRRPGAYGSIRRGLLVRVETGAERLKGTWRLKNSATLRSSPHFRCTRYSKKNGAHSDQSLLHINRPSSRASPRRFTPPQSWRRTSPP